MKIVKNFFYNAGNFLRQETKKHSLFRFIIVLLILAAYYIYAQQRFGYKGGFAVTILTWSFFVLSTPIADAGFILAFPVRLVSGIRMVKTQIFAYFVAIAVNFVAIYHYSYLYDRTIILRLSRQIITHLFPYYWLIIALSAIGTFFSIYFGDELMDISKRKEITKYHKHFAKYRFVLFIFIIVFTVILYDFLLENIGIRIPLI